MNELNAQRAEEEREELLAFFLSTPITSNEALEVAVDAEIELANNTEAKDDDCEGAYTGRELDCEVYTIEIPEENNSKTEVEITNTVEKTDETVASYTLSAMCEEEAIRAEEETAELLELQEAAKNKVSDNPTTETKGTETKTQKARARMVKALQNAKIDENGKMHLYILYEECGNDCMAYLISASNKKVRIASKLAWQLLKDGRAIKVSNPKVA